jgi:hypothetical protein
LHAEFKGRFDEKSGKLSFTKTYDGTGGPQHSVEYSGEPSDDKSKVTGSWTLDQLAGTFKLEKESKTQPGPFTSAWSGTYHYPDGQNPVEFQMILIQQGENVSGFIREPNSFGTRPEPWLHAEVKGSIDGATGKLNFTKKYDGTGGPEHEVEYSGEPSQDKNKVQGSWTISELKGTFKAERKRPDSANL